MIPSIHLMVYQDSYINLFHGRDPNYEEDPSRVFPKYH